MKKLTLLVVGLTILMGCSDDSGSSSSFDGVVVSFNDRVMRHDGPEGHVLLIETSDIRDVVPGGTSFQAEFDWQFPDDENTSAIYKGAVFGDWAPSSPLATIHDGQTPPIGLTQHEEFTFTTPQTQGIYCVRFILNAQFSMPSSYTDVTHYKYDFVFEVGSSPSQLNGNWKYVHRNDGPSEHMMAVETDNVTGQVFSPGQTVNADFTWQIPFSENFNAIYKGNVFGNWAQSTELTQFHDGFTPAAGVSQPEAFSFTAPSTPGKYAIRLILNASTSSFAGTFTDDTHYYRDLVFEVR